MSTPVESVLSKASRSQLSLEPFPHILLPDAIDASLCEKLVAQLPDLATLTQGARYRSNQRFSYPARRALADPKVSSLWREFIAAHVSQSFLAQVLALLGPAIRSEYPSFEEELGALEDLRAGVRARDPRATADVWLDAQLSVNTPVVTPSSVRRGHVDRFEKLFAGLFYLRPPEDRSRGGDLELFRLRDGTGRFRGRYIDDCHLETVKTVPYERNVLVLFLNTNRSLHGVTVRSVTPMPRYFLNLLGEVRRPLFDLDAVQQSTARRLLRGPVRRLRSLSKTLRA